MNTAATLFTQQPLNIDSKNLYSALASSVAFEVVGRGREGAILIDDKDGRVPLYRSTAEFQQPSQRFRPIHHELVAAIGLPLNNALIERYTSEYKKMGWHSDQSLDLADDSYIAVVSAYNRVPAPHEVRKLHIAEKGASKDVWKEVPINHGSVIVFSTVANQAYIHRIMLDNIHSDTDIVWIGVTFRLTKTYIQFHEGAPYLASKIPLRVASQHEKHLFFQAKGQQNSNDNYEAPIMDYTLSVGDTLPPID
eukprot:Phypoly_transcript_16336.p1 GENE.Phypoly_transcript_16336~~Phypoly_transcript_16336.p1  ORF type:complete len:262 (+),score=12.64 Phypoly_transcript_16336:34-786(+)